MGFFVEVRGHDLGNQGFQHVRKEEEQEAAQQSGKGAEHVLHMSVLVVFGVEAADEKGDEQSHTQEAPQRLLQHSTQKLAWFEISSTTAGLHHENQQVDHCAAEPVDRHETCTATYPFVTAMVRAHIEECHGLHALEAATHKHKPLSTELQRSELAIDLRDLAEPSDFLRLFILAILFFIDLFIFPSIRSPATPCSMTVESFGDGGGSWWEAAAAAAVARALAPAGSGGLPMSTSLPGISPRWRIVTQVGVDML
ncbi:MAG: hypothetical protein FRX49_11625 [Trebouxia sp. A1-2]|nr:MAG: hypothetical protein FRX49_11625 [Trebouxia sp. A1-2]